MSMANENIKHHARTCLETGKELGIEVFDLWSEMQKIKVSIGLFPSLLTE